MKSVNTYLLTNTTYKEGIIIQITTKRNEKTYKSWNSSKHLSGVNTFNSPMIWNGRMIDLISMQQNILIKKQSLKRKFL